MKWEVYHKGTLSGYPYDYSMKKFATEGAAQRFADKKQRSVSATGFYGVRRVEAGTKRNPAKAVRLRNFTGTVRKNANGTVSVVGRRK